MLKISFESKTMPDQGILVLTVAAEKKLGTEGLKIDRKLGGILNRAMETSNFKGDKGQTLIVTPPPKSRLTRLILVGIGKPEDARDTIFQQIGGAAAAELLNYNATRAFMITDRHKGLEIANPVTAAHAAYGASLRAYRFDKYRTKKKQDQKNALKTLTIAVKDAASARRLFAPLGKVAEGVFLARDLVSEPANILCPDSLAQRCKDLKKEGIKVKVLDEKDLKKLQMNALLGVGQGSAHPPCLVTLSWQGGAKEKDKRPVVIVGKGVTFDTGGLSLKPPGGMEKMGSDMAGAAAVIGAIKALAARKAKANVVGVIGLAENMPSGTAMRPGDVVQSMSGQTIEIINTDAEGRLVLADALWYAQATLKPRCVIDIATLTGAMLIALGHVYAGLFSNDDILARHLYEAGEATDENLWRFPMHAAYDKELDSSVADIRNVAGSRDAGSIMGAQFLGRFVKKGTRWAHLDIAGMALQKSDKPTGPKGATGFGVRLLERFVADNFEKQ